MVKAIKVQEENIDMLVEYAKTLNMNLSADLRDNYEYYAEEGEELYLITDGTLEHNNVTFTDKCGSDFFRIWTFVGDELPYGFRKIVRKEEA